MTKYSRLKKFWGPANLARVSPEQLQELRLPDSSKRFLRDVGLPINLRAASSACGVVLSLQDGAIPQLDRHIQSVGSKTNRGKRWSDWLRIGSAFEAHLCLHQPDGTVHRLEVNGDHPSHAVFVNSSIEQFVLFLLEYEVLASKGGAEHRGSLKEAVATLEGRLRYIDERVFEDSENWWSVIIEEMEHEVED